jgi:peptidyl-prolyl cis-trans isomerase A (cyclophilin A)
MQRVLGFTAVLLAVVLGCEAEYPEPRFGRQKASAEEQAPVAKPAEPAPEPAPLPKRKSLRAPGTPDPAGGKFTLQDALVDMPNKGKLRASMETSLGTFECQLFDDKAPLTVANFVGLARGRRPFWDEKVGEWVKRPLYDGTTFHRLIPDFVIQGGDHMGTGRGDVGYNVIDEMHPSLKHDKPGLLCMANKGPNTNGGQFFITDAATPNLTAMNSYTIFGECKPIELVHKIARVEKAFQGGESPKEPVLIKKVTISRK